jgi:hypothetical protein
MTLVKLFYKPFGLLAGVLGGLIASWLFERVWGMISDKTEAPDSKTTDAGWGEVILAVTIQGALFALVKGLVDRGGAKAYERMTGVWPGSARKTDD